MLSYRESDTSVEFVIHKATPRYVDQFLQLQCATDLLKLGLFPNVKEISESFAAIRALFIHRTVERDDESVHVISVGEGGRPRTATTLAFRTRWTCHAVDPQLQGGPWDSVERLNVYPARIEDAVCRIPENAPTLVVAVHSHIELETAIEAIRNRGADVIGAVALPCCGYVHNAPRLKLVADYEDWGIWSEWRTVKAWAR